MDKSNALLEEALISLDTHSIEILEEASDSPKKGMRIRGVALVDNAISENGRFYSKEFNDKVAASTEKWMEEGNVTTIFSRHGKAVGNPMLGQLPTGLPIGKVDKVYRDGNKIKYEGTIAPTTEGRDVMVLIESDVMRPTSIRCKPPVKSHMAKIGDRHVEVMEDAIINGIDFAERAGVSGAGIESVLEEAPQFEKLEEKMDWSKITLEELQANRNDLIEEIKQNEQATFLQVKTELDSKVSTLEEQLATATQVVESAGKSDESLTAELQATKLQLAIAKAAHLGVSNQLATKLEEVVKEESDIATELPKLRALVIEEARTSLGGGRPANTSATGASNLPDTQRGAANKSNTLMEEALRLSA